MSAPGAEPLVEACLAEHPLPDLLKALALSRQRLELRFFDRGDLLGTVGIVAGQVFSAVDLRSDRLGARAARALVASPGTDVSVIEIPAGGPAVSALCELAELVEFIDLLQSPVPKLPPVPAPAPLSAPALAFDPSGIEEALAVQGVALGSVRRLLWCVLGVACTTLVVVAVVLALLFAPEVL